MTISAPSFIRKIWRDGRGTSAIEFALVAPVLAFMTVGMSDMALALTRKYKIEQASYRALEMMTVGSLQGDYAYVRPEAAVAAGVPQANVTVTTKLECNGAVRAFGETCPSTQESARFVTVTIWDDYRPMFISAPLVRSANGAIRLTARSTIRVQ